MKKPVILVDMDDTVCNLHAEWCSYLKYMYRVEATPSNSYDKINWYPTLKPDQVFEPIRKPGFFQGLTPIAGALDAIQNWLDNDFEVKFSTVVYPDCLDVFKDKMLWIKKHIPDMARRTIMHTSHDKALLFGTILIDDSPKNIENAIHAIPICYDQPWNKHLRNRLRAHNWTQVQEKVATILEWKGYLL